ncbi:hypothetical protein [Mesobacillus jeotgali]|uniref:hypothetical protein n=1 Tax=Mesobacillus jeotgali TaxID=129985 RepID=UPI0015909BCD|nr:hypothetical protein [Mesobacillus jeotgali]
MEKKFSIGKVSFSQEMPEESKLWLERLVERILLKELDLDASTEAKLISYSDEKFRRSK